MPAFPSIEWHCTQPLRWTSRAPASAGGMVSSRLLDCASQISNIPGSWTVTVVSMSEWPVPQYSVHRSG